MRIRRALGCYYSRTGNWLLQYAVRPPEVLKALDKVTDWASSATGYQVGRFRVRGLFDIRKTRFNVDLYIYRRLAQLSRRALAFCNGSG
jgi:hypothetical protein